MIMLGNLILLCIPVFLWAFGSFCGRRGSKALFCMVFGIVMFGVLGIGGLTGAGAVGRESISLGFLQASVGSVSYESIGSVGVPPAYMLLLKLCSEFTSDIRIFLIAASLIQSVLAASFIYKRCSTPYAGAVVFTAGFMLTSFVSSSFFTAALICGLASRYVEERRFFRFAAMMLAAGCFDISAVLLIPLYFITLIPNVYAAAVLSAALASLAAIYGDITGSVFSYLGESLTAGARIYVPCAVLACVSALLCMLMHGMISNRDERFAYLIPFALLGAAFSVAGIFNGKLFPLSVFLLVQSFTVLAPEVYDILHRFGKILFPDKPYTVGLAVNAICFLAVIGIYSYTLFGNCYGSEFFGQALFGEGKL